MAIKDHLADEVTMAIKDHLADIDFRTRKERQEQAIPDFIEWYKDLKSILDGKTGLKDTEFNRDSISGQLQILSAVLWTLMPERDYRKLTRLK